MSVPIVEPIAAGPIAAGGAVDAVDGRDPPSRWSLIGGALITLAMLIGAARAVFGGGLTGLSGAIPRDPMFYLASVALYLTVPLGDYVIFRRLWRLPPTGLIALVKKGIANEVVLGYAGEAYFYAWAKSRAQMVAAPFGAVKDVSILSAIAGNAATILLVLLALPFAYGMLPPTIAESVGVSVLVVIAASLPFLIFSKRVFSLPVPTLWWIFGVHSARLLAAAGLVALAWHFGRPDLPLGSLMLLSAGRMLVGRLPLVPNKDLLFANFAILFVGQSAGLSSLVAVTAAFTLLIHLVPIVVFGLLSLIRKS